MRSTNVAGKTYLLMVLTAVRPGHADELRAALAAIPADDSPLARSPRTHMARFIVMADMPAPPGVKDPLDGPYLLFTSNFDGDLATYMDELVAGASPQLGEIYGHCIGCPQPAEGAALKAYVGRNQIDAGVVFAAYGAASVPDVLRAIDKRARLIDFVVRAQDMEPAQRRSAFLEEFGS
jgi:hypothetical protein